MEQAAQLSGGREFHTEGTAGAKEGRVSACPRSRKADVAAVSKLGEWWKSLSERKFGDEEEYGLHWVFEEIKDTI